MVWLIAYSDGTIISSEDMNAEEVPRHHVICIVQPDKSSGKHTIQYHNYYCWHKEGKWVPHDERGLNQYLDDITEPGIRLQGYWIPNEQYDELVTKARADPRLPKQTANRGEPPE